MSFIDNIKENLIGAIGGEPVFRACLFGEYAGYFENVTGIKSFTQNEIILYLKKGELKLKGENLNIRKYCEGDVVVCGKIQSVEKL